MTIVEFIEARIAEDEKIARLAVATHWNCEDVHGHVVLTPERVIVSESGGMAEPWDLATGQHMARHDPARILRQCGAMRAVLEDRIDTHVVLDGEFGCNHDRDTIRQGGCAATPLHEDVTLRALATIWIDHPDYREVCPDE